MCALQTMKDGGSGRDSGGSSQEGGVGPEKMVVREAPYLAHSCAESSKIQNSPCGNSLRFKLQLK